MNRKYYYIFLFIFLIILPVEKLFSQDNNNESRHYSNFTYADNIKTVMLYKEGWNLSYPFINLNSDEKLVLCFDELSGDMNDYSYIITHCDANWKPSDIPASYYIDGFEENMIREYEFSLNTLQEYVHYKLIFPNEDIKLTISGNYVIRVFKSYEPDSIILTRRFSIVEHLVSLSGEVKYPNDPGSRDSKQQINFEIHKKGFIINNPGNDLMVKINKNNHWFSVIDNPNLDYISGEKIIFENDMNLLSPGGNEYRHFDTKSLEIALDGVKGINFNRPYFDVYLFNDIDKNTASYEQDGDLNGKFFIQNQEGLDGDSFLDADYVFVHFNFPRKNPFIYGNIYIFGALSDWNLNDGSRMEYNYDAKSYELKMFLKQGYYNYIYVYEDNTGKKDFELFDGSHSETENDYLIYVYYNDPSDNYDKLIGLGVFNPVATK
ncbi:DUF5103 domain-containing protein [Bacteroidota bacterium]